MVKNIADRLLSKIDEKKNPCIVGLDPRVEQIPEYLKADKKNYANPFEAVRDTITEFNRLLIDALKDIVPAIKPQMAFFEQYGSAGVKAFEETVSYAKENGLIVIEDAKRNDIGSTVQAYANGHLGEVAMLDDSRKPSFDADFLTVSPFLGSDSLTPFVEVCKEYGKGIFVLIKTSNPSSGEIQDQILDHKATVSEMLAAYVTKVGLDLVGERGYSSLGAVVGATYPEQAETLRKIMPRAIFLVPGYGAQGGTADEVTPCFNDDGYGALVNSSRGIIFAYQKEPYRSRYGPEEFHLAARDAAIDMRDDVVTALTKAGKLPKW